MTAHQKDPYLSMLKGGLVPALVVGVVGLVWGGVAAGSRGVIGSGLATVLVTLSFGSSLLVLRRTARVHPIGVLAVALLTYVTKVGLLGLFLLLVGGADWLSREAFSFTAFAAAGVWLAGEVVAFTRVRTLVYDQHVDPSQEHHLGQAPASSATSAATPATGPAEPPARSGAEESPAAAKLSDR